MEPITLDEVAPLWPGGLAGDDERATALISLAQIRLFARVPSIPNRVDAGTLDRALVAGAIADIVARALTGPSDGATSVTDSAGPYSRSRSYAQRVFITDNDLLYLMPPKSTSRRWGSIQLGLSPYQIPCDTTRSGRDNSLYAPGWFQRSMVPEGVDWDAVVFSARTGFDEGVL